MRTTDIPSVPHYRALLSTWPFMLAFSAGATWLMWRLGVFVTTNFLGY